MKKWLSLLLTAVLLVSVALPALAEEKIELTYGGFLSSEATDGPGIARWYGYQNYLANHDEINVTATLLSHDDYSVKAQALAAANDLPDVFEVKGSWIENFVENGLILDLSSYLETVEWKDDYMGGAFDLCTYKGGIYGVPEMHPGASSVVYYNEALWKAAGYEGFPATFEELLAAGENEYFKANGITPFVIANGGKWEYECTVFSAIANRFTGDEWFESIKLRDGKAKFTDPEFVAALEYSAKIGASSAVNRDINMLDYQASQDPFCQGKAAAIASGSKDYILQNALPEVLANARITNLPNIPEATKGEPENITGAAGWFVCVNANLTGEKLQAALDFAFGFNGPDTCLYLAENFGEPTWIKVDAALPEIEPLQKELLGFYENYSDMTKTIYDVSLHGSIIDVLNTGLQEVLAGTMEPAVLAEQLQDVQEELMSE